MILPAPFYPHPADVPFHDGREGPMLTDYRGALKKPVLLCRGCVHLRVRDAHYFYCRAQGDQAKPDWQSGDWDWWFKGGCKRLGSGPRPDAGCPFLPEGVSLA